MGRRLTLGDRFQGRRARRDPSRAGHHERPEGAHQARTPARHRDRAGLRPAMRARPPVGRLAPGVVHDQARRHHRLRREPAEEVPGHLPPQLRQRSGRPVRGMPSSARSLDRRGHQDLPRRQPAHQTAGLLALADRRREEEAPRRAVPRRGVHPAGDDARTRQDRLYPELYLLHLAGHEVRAADLRARARRVGRPHASQLLRQHTRHPQRIPAAGRPGRLQDPRRAGLDALPHVGRVLGLRALRASADASGQRGISRLREVPVAPARLHRCTRRRPLARAAAYQAQPHPARAPVAALAAQPALPRHRQRRGPRIQQAGSRDRRHRARALLDRPAQRARGLDVTRPSGARHRVERRVRGRGPAQRRTLSMGAVQLRPARSARPAGTHIHRTRRTLEGPDVTRGRTSSSQRRTATTVSPAPDPLWFKRAVFYEVLVRGFSDSNGDGTGDLRGLTDKLDYLQWLGVDRLWLPPFYPSPLRDGGYDVTDYDDVLPEFGTIDDFKVFLDAAHSRGIKVIVDVVMNHTSDQHPWFQASRSDPDGPYGNYYLWEDDDTRYPDARIIFVDTEPSNWTFDPIRKQYFWHRFFSHQPDLNFDSPDVQQEMIDALRFWLDLGIDGFRLDAVPYLFVRDGTNGENLPEAHDFLKRLRKEIDRDYPDRVLLCEANQWPADVVEYFGGVHDSTGGIVGTECHMAFHFPVMPRIFMAVRREQRYPISEIMAQTPQIPENCQWGIFLRNHDELTLEMVSDEDRDYMWAEYAKDPRMKANIGIRRRLAPLLENDIDQIELFTALLFSLPGLPVLYYGSEIGMRDNIWLGDRDGVRTPMQWTPDRNAGFSTCDPGRLYLPVNMDSVYGYQVTNVEAQQKSGGSFLHWTKRMIEIRKRHPVFGLGGYAELSSSNPSVLAFVREHTEGDHPGGADGADRILCVNNLSRFPRPVELDLRRFKGVTPVECMGRVTFPRVGDLSYLLTLPGHGFYWFQLPPLQGAIEPAHG